MIDLWRVDNSPRKPAGHKVIVMLEPDFKGCLLL